MNLVLFISGVIGLTNIIVDSTLFSPIREWIKVHSLFWGDVVSCHQCTGFWCGLIAGCLCIENYEILTVFKTVLICGCSGSFFATAYTLLSDFVISKTDFALNEGNNG